MVVSVVVVLMVVPMAMMMVAMERTRRQALFQSHNLESAGFLGAH